MKAQSILWLSARWGGAFTLLVVSCSSSWRRAFDLRLVSSGPWSSSSSSATTRATTWSQRCGRALLTAPKPRLGPLDVPWRRFASRPHRLLWAQYFCLSYGWYFTRPAPHLSAGSARAGDGQERSPACRSSSAASHSLRLLSARLARRISTACAPADRCRRNGACLMLLLGEVEDPTWAMVDGDGELFNDSVMPSAWASWTWAELRGHLLRQHEHDGNRRRRRPDRRRLHPAGDGHNWALVLRLGGDLPARRRALLLSTP